MVSQALRTRALHLRLRSLPARLSSSSSSSSSFAALGARSLHISSAPLKRASPTVPTLPAPMIYTRTLTRQPRLYSSLHSSGKATSDLLVEELQDLYEAATDEFEIATDSTDSGTIYAASDRESARDALNQFIAVYHLYSAKAGEEMGGVGVGGAEVEGSPVVETNHDPAGVSDEVKEEVRKRVGQRVRELRSAVVNLEERAKAE